MKSKVEWVRPIFESIVTAMQGATDKPFKVAFLGPAQQSIIVDDQHYGDTPKLAKDIAVAMNKELKYLVSIGLEVGSTHRRSCALHPRPLADGGSGHSF